MVSSRWVRVAMMACASSILLACASLPPDVSPFADATAELSRSVKGSFRAVEGEMLLMSQLLEEVQAEDDRGVQESELRQYAAEYENLAKRVRDAREYRDAAMAAFVKYSDSLAGIVAAGKQGRESVEALAASLQEFVNVFGGPTFPMPIRGVAEAVGGQIIAMKAAGDLKSAVEAGDPAVQSLAVELRKDMDNLRKSLKTKLEAIRLVLELPYEERLESRREFLRTRNRLEQQLVERIAETGSIDDAIYEELRKVEEILKRMNAWYEPLRAAVVAAQGRLMREQELISATQGAIDSWAAAHRDVVAALRQNRPPNVRALVHAIGEIKELIEEVRKS